METMETGNKYCCVTEALHVLGRKLIGLELFRNGSVDEFYRLKALITLLFGTSEHFGGRKKKKNLN